MPEIVKTAEEILVEEKEQLFFSDMEESKSRQRAIIAHCDNEISYSQGQIALQEGKKEGAQKLLDELGDRFPTEE